ncbi:MAG: SurA N-terminal domain-containing protein [Propionibacteriaceae bacterium]|nr:SurA N-terminal domain-containing protein [Propionibacteriaceae bacterium]
MSKKLITSLALTAAMVGLAACSEAPEDQAGEPGSQEQGAEEGGMPDQEMPEPDLEGIPDVVAEVEGEEITGDQFRMMYESQFQQAAMQSQMAGEEVDQDQLKDETLESMIGAQLLVGYAEDEGYEASEEDIDEVLEKTAESSGADSVDEMLESVGEDGPSEEEMRADAADQVLIDQVVEDMDVEEPSDEEVEELYDQQYGQMQQEAEGGDDAEEGSEDESEGDDEELGQGPVAPEDGDSEGDSEGGDAEAEQPEVPELDEVRDELEQSLIQQKQSEAVMAKVEDLREDADVETHL